MSKPRMKPSMIFTRWRAYLIAAVYGEPCWHCVEFYAQPNDLFRDRNIMSQKEASCRFVKIFGGEAPEISRLLREG